MTLTPHEISALSLLARKGNKIRKGTGPFKELKLRGGALKIANAIVKPSSQTSAPASRAAKQFKSWQDENKKIVRAARLRVTR